MENWLQEIKAQANDEIFPKLRDIFTYLGEFNRLLNLIMSEPHDLIVINRIQENIGHHLQDLNKIYQTLLGKLNFKMKNLLSPVNPLSPANQSTNQAESLQKQQNTLQVSSISQINSKITRRTYSQEQKNKVVELHRNGMGFYKISKKLDIPYKNIMRWCNQKPQKQQNSRLLDKVQKSLWLWVQSHPRKQQLQLTHIQQKARELASNPQFKASIGWVKRFLKRCKLDNKEIQNLQFQIIDENEQMLD